MPPPPIARRSTPRVARISDRSASAPGRFVSWITNWLAMVVSPPDHAAWWRQVYDLRRRPGARPPTGRARGRPRTGREATNGPPRSGRPVSRLGTAGASAVAGRYDPGHRGRAERGEEGRMAEVGGAERGPKTIVFFPEGAYGPTNNCVGIGDVLRRRGHRVVFV